MKGGRAELVTLCLLGAVMLIGLWSYPPAVGFKALGPMNTSHEELACNACHKEAPGSLRQQLGHNTRSLMGMHPAEMVPVGFAPVDNAVCQDCHDRPNDRHPVSRFMETRFAEQRATLGPHECNNCHGEHHDQRVAMVEPGFCVGCHQDTEVIYDTAQPSHAELIEQGAWETCLQCHDFHGNHLHEVPKKLADGIPQHTILDYLKGGPDPYGSEKTITAKYP
jgi:predicted CXXCH cytochrome family protein